MTYATDHLKQNISEISDYLISRASYLKGNDRDALINEFKEWLIDSDLDQDDIWTIPDLTDDGLLDFFKRAISQK